MKKSFTLLLFLFLLFVEVSLSQVQVLKTTNYKSQDNVYNIPNAAFYGDCYTLEKARAQFGDSVYYYEYSARAGWYRLGTNFAYPFSSADYRYTSQLTGETINGNYAAWNFDIDTSTAYIVYNYILSSGNAASDCYYKIMRFGESEPVDSFRFDLRRNNVPRYMKNPNDPSVTYGVWVPMTIVNLYKGPKTATVIIGADTMTGFSLIRADGIRILKSDFNGPDLEFGRRHAIYFDSVRVEEEWGDVGLGDVLIKEIPIYNLGNQNLVISGVDFKMNTGRFSSTSTFPLTVAPGKKGVLKIQFRPYQEEFVEDTMVILSNDPQEPAATQAISGRGINYYFIMNGSDPNAAEPHYQAPYDSPVDPNRPRYQEGGEGVADAGWMNSGSVSPYVYPIPRGNLKSRVTTTIGFTAWAMYTFTLPPEKFGSYIMEYSGPFYSTNASSKVELVVRTPFVSDSQTTTFSQESLQLDGFWRQLGSTWQLNGGAASTAKYVNIQQSDEYLRTDLLRIRKIPTNPTISSEYQFKTYYFSNVSAYESERIKNPLSNKKKFEINSNGESLIRIDSIFLRRGYYYRILENMKFPAEVPAVNGKFSFTVEFNPNIIFAGYVDTIVVYSNASNYPTLIIRLYGSAVGDEVVADDKDATTFVYPPNPVDFAGALEPANYGKWYHAAGGYADRRLLGYIYQLQGDPDNLDFNKKNLAYVEWFPNFPAKTGGIIQADSFDVYAILPAGSANSNPAAKYVVYEYGGNSTIVIRSQNAYSSSSNPTGVPSSGELYLGRFQFLRGGKDSHGSGAIWGHVELWNDTSLVTEFYKNQYPNPAKKDSHFVRADAIIFREAAKPGQTFVVEPEIPKEFSISQNYPNPFNPTTQIRFSLPNNSKVEIKIYDMLGREVRTLINDKLIPGSYTIEWNGRNNFGQPVASGAYFYRIVTDKNVRTKKMLLMK